MAPNIATAAARLAGTIAAYSTATHQGIDRPLFWHVDGMRQARALLVAIEAVLADAPAGMSAAEEAAWWKGHAAGHAAGLAARVPDPHAAFVCPDCGPCAADEDGCCAACGADCDVQPWDPDAAALASAAAPEATP